MDRDLELSIVVAARTWSAAAADCLRTLEAQRRGRGVEILMVLGAGAGEAAARTAAREAVILRGGPGMLVPDLWALGLARGRGRLAALTVAECVPASDWVETLLAAAAEYPEAAGLGGPILPPLGGSGREWAAYLVRYSAYLGVAEGSAEEIPGDNAVYRGRDLERSWRARERGFWETLFHRELRRDGREIVFLPRLRVRLAFAPPTATFAALRFRHGRQFGSTRDLGSALRRLLAALAGPLLVPLLLLRIRRRLHAARPEWRGRFLLALPWLLVFLAAWSLGEASGYLLRSRR